ncbi:hypothetical protein [Ochrobactrum quorumnocens]|uniref:Uncharacterized protein n=1 Tax=Ochrobactrum quorumnocens TaxID=271865 RepID=A0A5N1K4R7_9HYPH|nr:hypothetical protein [[Ochrobactrum] quorumnocens]KAA9368375.1 hypothetical protein F3W84_10840 [[Ochrobactrum] quorumnocens]
MQPLALRDRIIQHAITDPVVAKRDLVLAIIQLPLLLMGSPRPGRVCLMGTDNSVAVECG